MSDIFVAGWPFVVSNLPLASKLLFFSPSLIQQGPEEVIAMSNVETNEAVALRDFGKMRLITLWILSGLVALAFLGAGGAKLAGTAAMVELFDKVGRGQ